MKRMTRGARGLVVALVCAVVGSVMAGDLAIQSFEGAGRLTFSEIPTATVYRVEWAPTLAGPWTNNWNELAAIQATGSGIVTCLVPMCYRVVAVVTVPSGMVRIPVGTNSGTDPDFGAYSLTVATFFMDATEVTKAQWDEVAAWGAINGYTDLPAGDGKAVNHPVQAVNWYDCVKWCNARSEKEGRTPCYTVGGETYKVASDTAPDCNFAANGYRLPTSTEWQYAARGGLSDKRFPWGDIIDHTWANYYAYPQYYPYDQGYAGYDTRYATGAFPYTSPAGAFAANGYGLYDMAGNVWEWCWDSSDKGARIVLGGGWDDNAGNARCGSSDWGDPGTAYSVHGFRAVCH